MVHFRCRGPPQADESPSVNTLGLQRPVKSGPHIRGRHDPHPQPPRCHQPRPRRRCRRRPRRPAAADVKPDPRRASAKRYAMKKSINLWAFPYPGRMTLARVPATGQGRRVRRHRAELRPGERPVAEGRRRRTCGPSARWPRTIGIAISGLCSFLFWPYSLTSNKPAEREPRAGVGGQMLEAAARAGHARTCWSCPGAVSIPWIRA